MVSYFVGGPLADRFSARRLIVAALLATSLGGLVLASIPPIGILTPLYGFWGLTTIFLFWAALIKTTRELGGDRQGQSFGMLDAGRGLFAAVMSSASVFIFASLLPDDVNSATFVQRSNALGTIILLFTGMNVFSALLVWVFVAEPGNTSEAVGDRAGISKVGLAKVMRMPAVWCQAVIILCAYVAYKSTDDFALYARDAFGYDEVAAAQIGTLSFWMRPIAAICAGLLADRFNASLILKCSFTLVMVGSGFIASGGVLPGIYWLLLVTVASTSAGIYALRGLYFAIFGDAGVPAIYTGSAVGLVSFIGFTPDIFMGPVMGYLIDSSPGAAGHQHVFAVVAGFAFTGFCMTLLFNHRAKNVNN